MRILIHVALLLALVLCHACSLKSKQDNITIEEQGMEVVEVLVAELTEGATSEVLADFGVVEPRSISSLDIRIVNTTDSPIVLLDYETTCRCTTLEFDRTPIAAGGEAVAVLTFDSRGEWGSVGNFLSIETSNEECAVVVWMSAHIE